MCGHGRAVALRVSAATPRHRLRARARARGLVPVARARSSGRGGGRTGLANQNRAGLCRRPIAAGKQHAPSARREGAGPEAPPANQRLGSAGQSEHGRVWAVFSKLLRRRWRPFKGVMRLSLCPSARPRRPAAIARCRPAPR